MARRRKSNGSKSTETTSKGTGSSTDTKFVGEDEKKDNENVESPKGKNDPEWYARDPRLVVDGASLPFNLPFGATLPYLDQFTIGTLPGGKSITNSFSTGSVPGVCSVVIKPSFGRNVLKTDPVNVCANALYTHVRYMNSGRKNYDPADLFIYAATFGDLYSFILWCERLYAYAFLYSQRNWYLGQNLIEANGVDPNNIKSNLANFRYWINSAINKLSSFVLPGDIYYFKRRAFMFSNYYLENQFGNLKDQLYQFVPEGFYRFEITGNTSAGALRYNKLSDIVHSEDQDHLITVSDLAKVFDYLMDNITGDEDFGLMSGDVLKAYGSNIIGLPQMPEEVSLFPVYDPYVLSQFKNATVYNVKRADPSATFNVGEDPYNYLYGDLDQSTTGLLISKEGFDWSAAALTGITAVSNKILTVENPDPGHGDILEATRLIVGYDGEDDTLISGTEIPVAVKYSYLTDNFPSPYSESVINSNIHWVDETNGDAVAVRKNSWLVMSSQFKYGPLQFLVWDGAIPNQISGIRCISNLDNTTMVSNDNIRRVHEIALLSLFYVPGVAKLLS